MTYIHNNRKKLIVIFAAMFLLSMVIGVILGIIPLKNLLSGYADDNKTREHNFSKIIQQTAGDSYITYTQLRLELESADIAGRAALIESAKGDAENNIPSKVVRIDTAEELYGLSRDMSYHKDHYMDTGIVATPLDEQTKAGLMGLYYQLGNNIDYSVMRSKSFMPIGYHFNFNEELGEQGGTYMPFSGTFDGNGFEIKNLYLDNEYKNHVLEFQLSDDKDGDDIPDSLYVALSPYFAMFSHNGGTVKNLGLIDPSLEMLFSFEDILYSANLVGENTGVVDKVYVIDRREDAGINMPVSSLNAAIAGIVVANVNGGSFTNSYFASQRVVGASYEHPNLTVRPVLHISDVNSTHSQIGYDGTLLTQTDTLYAEAYQTSQLMGGSAGYNTDSGWFTYPEDSKYPVLWGLEYTGGVYKIKNGRDMVSFAELLKLSGKNYAASVYNITQDIDMSEVSPVAYVMPDSEFSGTLSGYKNDTQNYYISNMTLNSSIESKTVYYQGFLRYLSGTVQNINFYNASLSVRSSGSYDDRVFNIGIVAAVSTGNIRDVMVNGSVNLGTQSIGSVNAGMVAGSASGIIENVYAGYAYQHPDDPSPVKGSQLDAGIHTYSTDKSVTAGFNLGGIIGSSLSGGKLTLYNALSHTEILSGGTAAGNAATVSAVPKLNVGGIAGTIVNAQGAQHNLGLLTHAGIIEIKNFSASSAPDYNVGGIIGLSAGIDYAMDSYSGVWKNSGIITFNNIQSGNRRAAGIAVSAHSGTAAVEFLLLTNEGVKDGSGQNNFLKVLDSLGNQTHSYENIIMTGLILHTATSDIIISQSVNKADYYLESAYNLSPVYYNSGSASTLLRYVTNEGDITYSGAAFNAETVITGITLATQVNFLNIINKGNITVSSSTVTRPVWIAGIAKELTHGHYLKNSSNYGKITFYGLSGQSGNDDTLGNLYVGGLIGQNFAGDLHNQDSSGQPKATLGIINSVNNGKISTQYSAQQYSVTIRANVYAGGIAAFNSGSIQDSINMEDIIIINSQAAASGNVSTQNATYGGRISSYRYGVVAGGIAASVTAGTSRIYDTSNGGQVLALSQNFARAGGILAQALYFELDAGNHYSNTVTLSDDVENSIIANGINYGNVSAVTTQIATYATGQTNATENYDSLYTTFRTTSGTAERPAIYSSAGGVIGYGLSRMTRMLNHGTVSSTDVAGGVVGATVVYSSNRINYVYIDTAINYGSVRAVNLNSPNPNFTNVANKTDVYTAIENNFYAVDDPFIFPDNITNEQMRKWPQSKRGIGGIFGRLQRGNYQFMIGQGEGIFNFIVNMDPNVDLIGRLDQVNAYATASSSGSLGYFQFKGATYYSARRDDTTQAVFTGIEYSRGASSTNRLYYRRYTNRIYALKQRYNYTLEGGTWYRAVQEYRETRIEEELQGRYTQIFLKTVSSSTSQISSIAEDYNVAKSRIINSTVNSVSWTQISKTAISANDVPSGHSGNSFYTDEVWIAPVVLQNGTETDINNYTSGSYGNRALGVPHISEMGYALGGNRQNYANYIYDVNFEMRTDADLSAYVYYVNHDVLSDNFKDSRVNGMYVLSTSWGSTHGNALPHNTSIAALRPIENPVYYSPGIDYENLGDYTDAGIAALQVKHAQLWQTAVNDKSALLDVNQNITGTETENPSGTSSGTELGGFTSSDFNNTKKLSYEININKFSSSQTGLQYILTQALLPANAIIASSFEQFSGSGLFSANPQIYAAFDTDGNSALSEAEFYAMLKTEMQGGNNISKLAPAAIGISGAIAAGTHSLGYFISYSEAAITLTDFTSGSSAYYTRYDVELVITGSRTTQSVNYQNNEINGATDNTQFVSGQLDIRTKPVNSSLKLNFTQIGISQGGQTKYILQPGTNIQPYISLYYQDVLVDSAYYTLSVVSVNSSGAFSFTLSGLDSLRAGDYTLKFKYFPVDSEKTVLFNKAPSTQNSLNYLTYDGGGVSVEGSAHMQSEFGFGYKGFLAHSLQVAQIPNGAQLSYLDNETSVLNFLNGQGNILAQIKLSLSPFAYLDSVFYYDEYNQRVPGIKSYYTAFGYLEHDFYYSVKSASGIETLYRHTLKEVNIDINDIYKNNNRMDKEKEIEVLREDSVTTISVDLGIDTMLYNLSGQNFDEYFKVSVLQDVANPDGIRYAADSSRYLAILIYDTLEPGDYTFTVSFVRQALGGQTDAEVVVATKVNITKLKGTSAYLSNIRFSANVQEIPMYPNIYMADADGVALKSPPYSPGFYYMGIDYDGADTANHRNFYVQGYVSNVTLDEYMPQLTQYLPQGARIARKIDNDTWSAYVYRNSTEEHKEAQLKANFTSEDDTDNAVIITYRVMPESAGNTASDIEKYAVYYHITVTDTDYNVVLIFSLYYLDAGGNPVLAENKHDDNYLYNKLVTISVLNFQEAYDAGNNIIKAPAQGLIPYYNYERDNTLSTNLFYYANSTQHRYRLARNRSGFYNFSVQLAPGYEYRIYDSGDDSFNESDVLPDSPILDGKYFYIMASSELIRTKRFKIVVVPTDKVPDSWGLNNGQSPFDYAG